MGSNLQRQDSGSFDASSFRVCCAGRPKNGVGSVVCFDWDCTITVKHMYKAYAGWDVYAQDLAIWCHNQRIANPLDIPWRGSIVDRMVFDGNSDLFRYVICNYFLGGPERVEMLKKLFSTLRQRYCATICILTRGEVAALHHVMKRALPEWAWFFAGGWVGDTRNEYFSLEDPSEIGALQQGLAKNVPPGEEAEKEDILEARFPFGAHQVLLVDDSISTDRSMRAGVSTGRRGGCFQYLDLPHEGDGIDEVACAEIERLVSQRPICEVASS